MKTMNLNIASIIVMVINALIKCLQSYGVNVLASDCGGIGPAECVIIHDDNMTEYEYCIGFFPSEVIGYQRETIPMTNAWLNS